MRLTAGNYEERLHLAIRIIDTDFFISGIEDFGCCAVHYELTHVLCDLKEVLNILVEKHEFVSYDAAVFYKNRMGMKELLKTLEKNIELMILNIISSNLYQNNRVIEFLWKARKNLFRATEANLITQCPGHNVKNNK